MCTNTGAQREGHFQRLGLRWEPPYTATPPSPEIPKKFQKGVPGPPAGSVKKMSKKSQMTRK